ncbi:Cytoplasmic dynein 1 intermediate chain 1/2 [Trinorchestia longiramus]|nr:Cytoplasmic dynein 1 intermediate chain 1/2 [Trinorchestia longiramus]
MTRKQPTAEKKNPRRDILKKIFLNKCRKRLMSDQASHPVDLKNIKHSQQYSGKMSDRKAELERKKAKLLALREEKDRRKREKEQKEASDSARSLSGQNKESQQDLDKILSSLGVAPVSGRETVSKISEVLSSLSSVSSDAGAGAADSSIAASADTPDGAADRQKSTRRRPVLSMVSVQSTNIPPKETVTYTRGVQTTGTTAEHGYFDDWWRPRKGWWLCHSLISFIRVVLTCHCNNRCKLLLLDTHRLPSLFCCWNRCLYLMSCGCLLLSIIALHPAK